MFLCNVGNSRINFSLNIIFNKKKTTKKNDALTTGTNITQALADFEGILYYVYLFTVYAN